MFSGQYILVIGSLSILTLLILTFYNADGNIDTLTLDNEAIIAATGIGQTIIEKMAAKSFDENVINSYLTYPDSLTSPSLLRAEEGETSIDLFDDFDDFNQYTRTDTLNRLGHFDIVVNVHYVEKDNPDTPVSSKSFHKLATVSVSNKYLLNTLKLSLIASY
jgi:hypothetical protein